MDEFGLIAKYLAPLATGEPGALGLTDDAAIVAPKPGHEFVVTKDALTDGVHFRSQESNPGDLASKLVRVNLSDMAAMGAAPRYYLIAGILPSDTDEAWTEAFCAGLAAEQEAFGITLIGGDTVRYNGPLSLSLTMMGEVEQGKALTRAGAQVGEAVYVSGTVGDATLGLQVLNGDISVESQQDNEYLLQRYHRPDPRVVLGQKLVGLASSCIDVSDGLLGDLAHICDCSAVGAVVQQEAVPLSDSAKQLIERDNALWEVVCTGGDDYELLFTVPQAIENQIESLSEKLGVTLTKIGHIAEGSDVQLQDAGGNAISYEKLGYQHG